MNQDWVRKVTTGAPQDLSDVMRDIERNPGTETMNCDEMRGRFDELRDASMRMYPIGVAADGALVLQQCESSPIPALSDERLAEIEAEHQPEPWLKEHRGLLWCNSPDCNQHDVTGAVHVDWPCDAAQLVAEVRRLRGENHLLHLSRGASEHVHPLVAAAQRWAREIPTPSDRYQIALIVEWAVIWGASKRHGDADGVRMAERALLDIVPDLTRPVGQD